MREHHIVHLRCPLCKGLLQLCDEVKRDGDRVQEGTLRCTACGASFPIFRFVPRFVRADNYAASFGLEWTRHARTQYDINDGHALSEDRFFDETRWPRDLRGEIVIEPGSGSGRFTEQAALTGATVLSMDYSAAVDANYASNGGRDNVLIVQGDVYQMPFPEDYADRLFCFGVLQHTPDPRQAFLALPRHLKAGGNLVADIYVKSLVKYVLGTKYWVRPLTTRVAPERLYDWIRRYVDLMWPISGRVRRIPRFGPSLNWRLLIADYSRELAAGRGGDDSALKEWAYLDTFDMLAPAHDHPQTMKTVRRWCEEANLVDVEVGPGYNGIEIRARRSPE
jgi:SAM-dependent methyltransferase